ncbi:hypothetical protein LJ656_23010 [Paraburkholderia sp. MMS20-SJTR3]|uniref:Uncharacterized protein n=1 Tax=Paraburkholderia sejongensis TaxID=2886946 RepID=A0ABS8JZZ5_9BURK|nr:hypothetical protein [Paraburkholderia sp. MMS20-SJTR3]MCC8395461.1 hypothetical protein [Paraburkholderia sp. MMS20-SJTR3]
MVIRNVSEFFGRIFLQRCFYLFIVLMLFICAAPFVEAPPIRRFAIICANAFMIAAVASVGRSTLSFIIAVLPGLPALAFQWIASAARRTWEVLT